VNEMMGFGRQGKGQASSVPSISSEIEHYEMNESDPFSTPTSSRRTSQVVASEFGTPQRSTQENGYSAITYEEYDGPCSLHVSGSPEPEEFYRSSAEYVAARAEWQEPLHTGRPLTPYPRMAGSPSSRISCPYVSVPLPSSQRHAIIKHDHAPSKSNPPLRRRYGLRRPNTPPPRLPADYRAKTAFSFDRPPTTTPFSTQDARPMSPSHWLYNAPRVGGVELEVRALQQATEARTSVHRALWPEEREKVLGEIDGIAMKLIRGAGVVVGVREDQMVEETKEHEVVAKKKRFEWLKKLWFKNKDTKTKPSAMLSVVDKSASTHQTPRNLLQAHYSPGRPSQARPSSRDAPTTQSSPGGEQRQSYTSTAFEAGSSMTAVATPSPPRARVQSNQAVSRMAPPLSSGHDAKKRSRAWWHFYTRGVINHASRSQESLR
jgi:hypothetical protein